MREAPLFTKGYTLFSWLLDRLGPVQDHGVVKDAVLSNAHGFLSAITLALQGFDTPARLYEADEALALLRLDIRLAEEKQMLSQQQYRFVVETLDDLGRQLGGWRKQQGGL